MNVRQLYVALDALAVHVPDRLEHEVVLWHEGTQLVARSLTADDDRGLMIVLVVAR